MTRSQSGGYSSVQRKEGEDTHLGFMISLSTVGPLELVQNDMAVDWEVQHEQRGDGKENQRLVIQQAVYHEKQFYHQDTGQCHSRL